MKLPDREQRYPTAKICFQESSSAKTGDHFFAYGFPHDQNFQPVDGTLGTANAPGGRWAAASAFTYGMSGGPVYNSRGYVLGLVKGGLENTDAVRWITPIEFAKPLLYPPFGEQCNGKAPPEPVEVRRPDPPSPELRARLIAQCEEATTVTSTLATSTDLQTWRAARDRFWVLYWGPMYTLETFQKTRSPANESDVEFAMVGFGPYLSA